MATTQPFKDNHDPAAAAAEVEAAPPAILVEPDEDPMAKLAAAAGVSDPAALQAIIDAAVSQLKLSNKAEMDAMRAEMQAVQAGHEGKIQDGNESMGGYPWMYYRIPQDFPDEQRRGWITVGPGGAGKSGQRDAGSFNNYLKKGFLPITKYGKCPVPTSPVAAFAFVDFVKNGGWKEFPPSQLVAYNWHKKNPFAKLGVRFPQLDPVLDTLVEITCEYCGFELSFMPGDKTAGTAYRTHLVNTDKVTFKEAIDAVKAIGLTTTPFRMVRGADEARAQKAPV